MGSEGANDEESEQGGEIVMGFDFDLIDDSYYTHCCLDDVVCEQTFEELLGEYECGDADPLTTYRLGKFYINGIGVEEDPDEGIRLVKESAESGLAEAQNELGRYYDAGEIVEQDLGEAFKWFSKAADQDMSAALINLGRAYENGYGVEQDDEQAFDYYLRAAEQGSVRGEFEVGCAYDNGIGVDEDKEEAHVWYLRAAEHGNAPSQFNVAWNYEHGEGVELDEGEAFAWYLKAADQGYAAAQNNLGVCYEYGRGTPIDIAKAEEWYRKAADRGDDDAKENLVKIRTAAEDRIVAELEGLIGLDTIKENVRRLFKLLRTQAKRRAAGLKVPALSYHCIFSGNPGTGKTTVARILAKIYQATGVVKTDKFVEAGREDLVAERCGDLRMRAWLQSRRTSAMRETSGNCTRRRSIVKLSELMIWTRRRNGRCVSCVSAMYQM